jgi:hypothetical protein
VKDLHNENYKILNKVIEEDSRRWMGFPCTCTGRINIVRVTMLLKAIYIFSATPFKISTPFFAEIEKTIIKFTWKL